MALSTLAKAKSHLGIPTSDTTNDARVQLFLDAASQRIETYCDRVFEAQSTTEYHNGNGTNIIVTNQYPINSITEIRISNAHDWTVDEIDADDLFVADRNQVIVYSSRFPKGFANIRAIYNAGYVTIPFDLELACLWFVEFYYKHRERGDMGRTSIGKGDESVGILAQAPTMILEILNDYKRTEVYGGSTSSLVN